jgi:LmbE family N-acetylglucosaminyl deacetylase
MHILAIGAHAMDAEVLAGPILINHVEGGGTAELIHVTRGERGKVGTAPETFAAQLEHEMAASARLIGCNHRWLGLRSEDLSTFAPLVEPLSEVISTQHPDIIVTHWRGSWHQRHVQTHLGVVEAIRYAASQVVPRVLFGEHCEDLVGFSPTVYADITNSVEAWLAALESYETFRGFERQVDDRGGIIPAIPYRSFYTTMAHIRGLEAGVQYAKPFMEWPRVVEDLEPTLRATRLSRSL